jgi:hypothetical protein
MPYLFTMKHDNRYVQASLENEAIWNEVSHRVGEHSLRIAEATGNPIDAEALGTVRGKITSSHRALDAMFPLRWRWAVSQPIRDYVEAIEPGVHQFIPFDVTLKTGERPAHRYYLLNICSLLDAIDPNQTTARRANEAGPFLAFVGLNRRIVARADKVAGKVLWMDCDVIGGGFMSDDLQNKLVSMNCTRLQFQTVTCSRG